MRVEFGRLPRVRRVLLDGREMRDVRWADDQTGEIERAVRDGDGRLVKTPDGENTATEVLRGLVVIDLK